MAGFFLRGDRWTSSLTVRDLGGYLDTTWRGFSSPHLPGYVLLFLVLILFLPFSWAFMVLFGLFVPCFFPVLFMVLRLLICLKVVFLKLRAAVMRAVWSRKQPLASSGAVLGLLDGPHGCDPSFCLVWFRFLGRRRFLG